MVQAGSTEPIDPDSDDTGSSSFGEAMRAEVDVLAVIAVGGALGAVARWALIVAWPHAPAAFAWSTWTINVTGSFALGVLTVLVARLRSPHRYLRPFLGVGVLGGFTTFSTYLLDARTNVAASAPLVAVAYLIGSVAVGLLAAWAGLTTARRVLPERGA